MKITGSFSFSFSGQAKLVCFQRRKKNSFCDLAVKRKKTFILGRSSLQLYVVSGQEGNMEAPVRCNRPHTRTTMKRQRALAALGCSESWLGGFSTAQRRLTTLIFVLSPPRNTTGEDFRLSSANEN